MPIADLPYRIERLTTEGQYAYLARPVVRAKIQEEKKKPKEKTGTRLRVLRNVNLCDGPTLWDSIREKFPDSRESYGFYVVLRLFATREMVQEYLSGQELASYCQATKTPIPILTDEDLVITEDSYMNDDSVSLTKNEYTRMLHSRDSHMSLESLEELVCQIQGIDSLEALGGSKRGRKKKVVVVPVVEESKPLPEESQDEEEEGSKVEAAATSASDRPTPVTMAPKKKKPKGSLRDQFVLVQNTPSRVIDVSSYGDTMQHQRGKILDRVRHGERISQCTSLGELFPIISDNIPAFERAMNALGSRYSQRLSEFRAVHTARTARKA